MSLRRLFEYLTPYATTATSPASHQTTFEKYELAYQYMRFWRTFLYQHVCRCTHNVEHDSDIFYDVSVCYRQWYWRCGAFYGFLIARPAQRNESIHYVPQDRSKTARKKERACGRFRTSEPPANPHYSNKKATSFSADGFGPSGESRTHGLLNPMQIGKTSKNLGVSRLLAFFFLPIVAVFAAVFETALSSQIAFLS